jgi:hypothetical protein
MEEGFVIDRGHGNAASNVATWVEGQPELSWIGKIKTRDREQFRLGAFMCRKCGYVELNARPQSE